MNMYEIIVRKRDGHSLTKEEIQFFVEGYTEGSIPDYQAAAFLMAIYFQKMNKKETFYLTDAMMRSGELVDLSQIPGIKVDKHSTGGVGDKTTLIVAPLAAACGVPVAKMSGRGLGFTGGTVDKMESIPGFRTFLEPEEFLNLVKTVGLSVIGQTAHIAAADKKLYALRDVTATVDNISLITSSIMSKKLASGSDAIVLDVKTGDGAFMEQLEDAKTLGSLMVEMGTAAGKKTIAVITDMNQPLGRAVGNSLEVIEAIDTLKGKGPKDIEELSLQLAGLMIYAGEKAETPEKGVKMAMEALKNGNALKKLGDFVEGQGGNRKVIEDYSLFPQAKFQTEVLAEKQGYIVKLEARRIGMASQHTGAGRETKESLIDLSAGILLHKKMGDFVEKGEILATLFGNDQRKVENSREEVLGAYHIEGELIRKPILIKEVIF